jgi:protein-tyrosine-phosphatase
MSQKSMIGVGCGHVAAKSIIAAYYFNKIAQERNLSLHAIARGTHPDAELSPKTVAGLREAGLAPTEAGPQELTREELESAQRIVSFCDLSNETHQKAVVEQWDDIPPVSEDYQKARDAIVARLEAFIEKL